MFYLIIGRTGTGKDTLADMLQEKGLKRVVSYTTRPRRTPDENTHIFVTKEEADKITDRAAEKTINGYEYFATKDQVKNANMYIIDPDGARQLTQSMPEEAFMIVHVKADPSASMKHAAMRAEDPEKEEEIVRQRVASEDQEFSEFEQKLAEGEGIPGAVSSYYVNVENDYDPKTLKEVVDYIIGLEKDHYRMEHMIASLRESGNLPDTPEISDTKLAAEALGVPGLYDTMLQACLAVWGDKRPEPDGPTNREYLERLAEKDEVEEPQIEEEEEEL